MNELTEEQITKIAKKHEAAVSGSKKNEIIAKAVSELFNENSKRAILGMDIFKYSQFPSLQQALIPHIFREVREFTIKHVLHYEPFIFQNYSEEKLIKMFIDTGDGGFQIFDNPFDATIFALYFQLNLHLYNSGDPINAGNLNSIVGELKIRYAITYDDVYCYNNNFYGPTIINNARILSKDKLDRCIVEQNVIDWYFNKFNGFESLRILKDNDFKSLDIFKSYDHSKFIDEEGFEDIKSLMFSIRNKEGGTAILNSNIMNIGTIRSKQTELSVYSILIQVYIISPSFEKEFNKMVTSIGSYNPQGINDN